jgi:hypothetical protein
MIIFLTKGGTPSFLRKTPSKAGFTRNAWLAVSRGIEDHAGYGEA